MIKIDKGIPVPPPTRKGSGRKPKYPWREMEIGDSFYVDCDSLRFRSQTVEAGPRYGRKFSVRKEGAGTRVWRIE